LKLSSFIPPSLGYLYSFTEQLLVNLDQVPGDARTQIGFVAYDSSVHFFEFFDPQKPPRELVITDVEGRQFYCYFLQLMNLAPFIPVPSNLLVNLKEYAEVCIPGVKEFICNF
jgi:protein transport protein SEC24